MKIRSRLQISNILMIVIPVGITAVFALLCLGMIWFAAVGTSGLSFDDQEEFYEASQGITAMVENALASGDTDKQLARLESYSRILDETSLALTVVRDGEDFYRYGVTSRIDESLIASAQALGDNGSASRDGRSVYARAVETGGHSYHIFLCGSDARSIGMERLKDVILVAAAVLAAAVVLSILATNWFLTRFVFRKIARPLDILGEGVQAIAAGDLDYRIRYKGRDEFSPIVDEFNEMAARLAASAEEIRRHEESRKELMAGISHDLRSPLTSIQAYVEGILDGVAATPDKQQQYLRMIKTKAEDIERMVSQIFLYSKMDLAEFPVHMQALRLDEAVQDICGASAADYARRGLDVQLEAAEPLTVMADPELLRRILVNLLDNSLKYKTAARGTATVSLRAEGDDAVLTARDDGPGVRPEAVDKLFDIFYRSDPARHNPNQGSGLGLAIVAKAVGRMGGRISARNVAPHGLAIEIRFAKGAANEKTHTDC
ncbi:MAG: HAMP domain-containing sensor histidine kinase [Peptococcaceae bacterium]|nr:HAMP domain-containing sensor histidine kinase [Peptococcaceae bacterium]